MTAYLEKAYGPMQADVNYTILEEGYDYYLFTNGMYVPKNLVRFRQATEGLLSYDDLVGW